jgi:hypothetical protein
MNVNPIRSPTMRSFLHRTLPGLLALAVLLPAAALAAQGVWHKGDLSIRYNALPASALPAASTQQLGLENSDHQGLLNVVVTRGGGSAPPSIPADVSARASTENGSPVSVHVRTIKDANGISYLGTFPIAHTGKLRFDLDVTPQGAATQHIQFTHTFVVE